MAEAGAVEAPGAPGRLVLVLKWGGCFTALVFAIGGLLCDVLRLGDTVESMGRACWVVVAVSMAIGFAGVLLDRPHRAPPSPDPASNRSS